MVRDLYGRLSLDAMGYAIGIQITRRQEQDELIDHKQNITKLCFDIRCLHNLLPKRTPKPGAIPEEQRCLTISYILFVYLHSCAVVQRQET